MSPDDDEICEKTLNVKKRGEEKTAAVRVCACLSGGVASSAALCENDSYQIAVAG